MKTLALTLLLLSPAARAQDSRLTPPLLEGASVEDSTAPVRTPAKAARRAAAAAKGAKESRKAKKPRTPKVAAAETKSAAPSSPKTRKNGAKPERKKSRRPPELVVSTTPITVIFPPEGHRLEGARGEFLFGSVSHPLRAFRINGSTVTVHRSGGFLAYLPVSPGTATFVCELDLPTGTTALARTVHVRGAASPLPADSLAIVPESVSPSEDLELRPGDWLTVRARGTPGLDGDFSLGDSRSPWPMTETSPGVYEGAYQVRPADAMTNAAIAVTLGRSRRQSVRAEARGRLTVPDTPPPVAVVRGANANIRSAPEQGFILFPPAGTPLVVTGRSRGYARVWLSPTLSGWVDEKSLDRLPPGSPPPDAVLTTIHTTSGPDSTTVWLDVSQTVPFSVEESVDLDRVTVRFYYCAGHTNWVIYDPSDRFLRQVRWEQRGTAIVEVTAYLQPGQTLWGYDASWQGSTLRLELRHPPRLAPAPASVFKDRVIVLDPGHMPSSPGTVGPRGTLEVDTNWWIAKDLQGLLAKEGAQTIMTKSSRDEEAGLLERQRLAWSKHGEIFVSLHNNALPDGENPFSVPHGFSVFYYHPHSLSLARAVYQAYERGVPLPGEGLRYGDLFVARATQMPSVLTESAYLMFPDQEDLLLVPARRKRIAAAILEGLRRFLEGERTRQSPPAPAAPVRAKPGRAQRRP